MTTRSYNQYCGLSYALDVVGERWTILIIRELMAGPRRFKDLMDGLPGISTNLLTERLKSLEQQHLLVRRVLPPPAGSTVYALTPLGLSLEKSLLELGRWGSQFVPPTPEGVSVLHASSYALTLKTFFRPEVAKGVHESYELHIDDEILQVHINDGEIAVQQGEAHLASATFYTSVQIYLGLLTGNVRADQALADGLIRVEGDPNALCRFLSMCALPSALESTKA
jgi:DNA-binding HxlR family transcriptional regulator/putative sterol carrier protein